MSKIINDDCITAMKDMRPQSIDVVLTSPPYNINIKYGKYTDRKPRDRYLAWLNDVFSEIKRVMKSDASFFLNVGFICTDPWIPDDVASIARHLFKLQNRIVWVKNVSVEDRSYGHFKPINSERFINQTHEYIYHFSKDGNIHLDRLSIGVPFQHKSNIKRFGHDKDVRCRGNVWYIPYETKQVKDSHPCIFPIQLAKQCIELHGANLGLTVLDPFLGSGTTLIACNRLGVNGIGIDIDKDYCDLAQRRLDEENH